MVGIKDIAKKAGVSISTVSYALNGSSKVTEETRARIKAIADELNYVPNMAARTLKRQQTNIIGVYLASYSGSFYGELMEGIKSGLATYGYEMIVCSGEKSHLFIPERMIDGGIVLDWGFGTEEILKYAQRGYQMVVLDRVLEHANVRTVLLDNRGGATLAVQHFIEKQSKKVYVISGPKESFDAQQRLTATVRELERYNIDYQVVAGNFTADSGYTAAKKILSMSSNSADMLDIFALNDEMAIGVYQYLEEVQIEVGKQVCIIGFDNTELAKVVRPRLATVSYSMHRWGMVAAEKIIKLIRAESTEDELIYTTFINGDSFL